MIRRLVLLVGAALVLAGCGSEYDPDLCAQWTDLYHLSEDGDARVQMDRYCER